MSQLCPQCAQEVPDSFGITTCQHCGFTFFPGLAAGTADAVLDESSEISADPPTEAEAPVVELMDLQAASSSVLDQEPMSAESFRQEIQEFASEKAASVFLTYRFLIQGIDTVQIRRSVLDVLSDPRLGLDIDVLPSQIRQGTLILNKLNAAQASFIARHLGSLSVEMEWNQESL